MDTEKIRAFLTVIETGTISGTAEKLGYTTSGISRLVAALEEDAGFPLLKRYHSGVIPTAECTMLLPVMTELLGNAEKYRQLTAQLIGLEVGTITIGTAYSEYYKPLATIVSQFVKEHPGIQVQIVEGTSSHLSQLVADNRVDFCIISRRQGPFSWTPMGQDELVALVSHNHPAVSLGYFSPMRFTTEPFIELYPQCETDNSLFFTEAAITTNTCFSTYDVTAGVAMVEAGLGVTLTNNLWAKKMGDCIVALPLKPAKKIDIGIATPTAVMLSPAAKQFASFAIKKLMKFAALEGLN